MARTAALAPRTAALAPARTAGALVAVVLVLLAAVAPSAGAAAGWGRPFRLAGPATLDVTPAELSFSPTGNAAIAFSVQDEDNPATSNAFTTLRAPSGAITGPQRIPGAQAVLDLAYDGPDLELLVGTSPRGMSCCSSVQAIRNPAGGRPGRPQPLLGRLTGATVGQIVTLAGRLLAAIATEHGVWVAQTGPAGRFGSARRLTPAAALPEALAATNLPKAQSIVAWTALDGFSDTGGPRSISVARGSALRAPQGPRVVLTVAAGHRIDELAVAPGPRAPTIAWMESWYDAAGGYHSEALIADLNGPIHPHQLSATNELAYGLSFAGDGDGRQAIAWGACTDAGTCAVRGALRPLGRPFAPARTLGAIDAAGPPTVAVAPTGEALLGWLDQGHVLAASGSRRATRFGAVRTVSGTGFAADLALSFGPLGRALAVWTQGTLAQSLVGAVYAVK